MTIEFLCVKWELLRNIKQLELIVRTICDYDSAQFTNVLFEWKKKSTCYLPCTIAPCYWVIWLIAKIMYFPFNVLCSYERGLTAANKFLHKMKNLCFVFHHIIPHCEFWLFHDDKINLYCAKRSIKMHFKNSWYRFAKEKIK